MRIIQGKTNPKYRQEFATPEWKYAKDNPTKVIKTDFMTYLVPYNAPVAKGTIRMFEANEALSGWTKIIPDSMTLTDSEWGIPHQSSMFLGSFNLTAITVNDAVRSNSAFILVGNAGKVFTSVGGTSSWVSRTSGTTYDLIRAAYNPVSGNVIACSSNVLFVSSDNGTTWINIGSVGSNYIITTITVVEDGFCILAYDGGSGRHWGIINVNSSNTISTLRTFTVNTTAGARTAGKNSMLYAGDNILFFGVADNDLINNVSSSRIYKYDISTQTLTILATHTGLAGYRIYTFFKIGTQIYVRNIVGTYISNSQATGTAKISKNGVLGNYKITDTINFQNFCYRKGQITVPSNVSLYIFRGDSAAAFEHIGSPITATNIVTDNNNLMLTFESGSITTYCYIFAATNKWVTTIPYAVSEEYAWFIKN